MNDVFAILSFNLLGLQYYTRVDTQFIRTNLKKIAGSDRQIERALFEIRLQLLEKSISSQDAIHKYNKLMDQVTDELKFTWTGVKHHNRLDSYFVPFGNMTVRQRNMLETCREYSNIGDKDHYSGLKDLLAAGFNGLKKALLLEYMKDFIEKPK